MANKTVVFTGFRDANLQKVIENAGGHVASGITGATDILIIGEGAKAAGSAKAKKAAAMGIKVMRKWEFGELLSVSDKTFLKSLETGGKQKEKQLVTEANGVRSFYILDNGGKAFQVLIDTKAMKFSVFKCTFNDFLDECTYEKQVIKPTKFLRAFIGDDNEAGHRLNHGNSILVQLTQKRYMSIGWVIYEFTPGEEIVSYESPVGNSGVPYPYAIGKSNTFLLIENVAIPNDVLAGAAPRAPLDPYEYYYGHGPFTNIRTNDLKKKYKYRTKMVIKRIW